MNLNPLKILLADDDSDDCCLFQEAMEELPLSVQLTTVADGEKLIQKLKETSNSLPDVLFLDLNMPRKNGCECLAEIKRCETLKKIPVIIFSTSFAQETVNRLYEGGAHYYIRKPNDFSKLTKVLHQALTLIAQKNTLQPPKANFVLSDKMNTYSAA